jgi:hypothetical protein
VRELIILFPNTGTKGLIAARTTGNLQSFFVIKHIIEQVKFCVLLVDFEY